jgi:hypothetical protein
MTTETKSTERYRSSSNPDELVTLLTSVLQQMQARAAILPSPLGLEAQAAAAEYDRYARLLTHELPRETTATPRSTR